MTTPTSSNPGAFDPENVIQRREFIQLLVLDPDALESISEASGFDVTPVAVRALATELFETGCELLEAREELAEAKAALECLGALSAGLLGLETASTFIFSVGVPFTPDRDDDPEWIKAKAAMRRRGAEIREGALS